MKNIGKLLLLFCFVGSFSSVFSQNEPVKTSTESPKAEQVYVQVEKKPEYIGGVDSLLSFIAKNVVYPQEAISIGIEGNVVVRFIVDKTGKVTYPEVLRSVNPLLDNAALDVVKKLPNFIPGTQAGKNVSAYYLIPIKFNLSKLNE